MSDNLPLTDQPPSLDNTAESDSTPVKLRFPTIDSRTSLESLLSRSTSAIPAVPPAMAQETSPTPAMEESWASLDVSDFSHDDDDNQSETTDPGSLVDVSSTHETESANEDESESESGFNEEQTPDLMARAVRNNEQVGQPDTEDNHYRGLMEDTIILRRAAAQPQGEAIELEYIREPPASLAEHNCFTQETIRMTISPKPLQLPNRPVRVAYYGTELAVHTKDELLGKIGAALVSPSSTTSSQTSLASTCFSIVPTEFGPGSRPAFADLVPSQAQMTIDEISGIKLEYVRTNLMHFGLKRGVTLESRPAKWYDEFDSDEWRPDLFVIHFAQEDRVGNMDRVESMMELADRHSWPVIAVAKDASVIPFRRHAPPPVALGIRREGDVPHGLIFYTYPIDLDTFMAIDTDQLSHHIKHIIDESLSKRNNSDLELVSIKNSVVDNVRAMFLPAKPGNLGRHTLKAVQPQVEPDPSADKKVTILSAAKRWWSTVECGRHLKDVFFSLVVMMLGVYIVSFSQNFSSKTTESIQSGIMTATLGNSGNTATVTATLALQTQSTDVVVQDRHDIDMYEPVTLDQMWHRLTGRPVADSEKNEVSDKVQKEEQPIQDSKIDSEETSTSTGLTFSLMEWLESKLDSIKNQMIHKRIVRNMGKVSKLESELDKHSRLQNAHEKVHDFYQYMSKQMPGLSRPRHNYFKDLVFRSQHHLKHAHKAGKKRLDRLMSKQKKVLSRAQDQAQYLAPSKKKRSFFGRG